jgi:hypothetical protein
MTILPSGQREQVILSSLRAERFATSDEMIDEAFSPCYQPHSSGSS